MSGSAIVVVLVVLALLGFPAGTGSRDKPGRAPRPAQRVATGRSGVMTITLPNLPLVDDEQAGR
jgi:hypothetical protein